MAQERACARISVAVNGFAMTINGRIETRQLFSVAQAPEHRPFGICTFDDFPQKTVGRIVPRKSAMAPIGYGQSSDYRSPWRDPNTCNGAHRKCTGLETMICAQNQESTDEFRVHDLFTQVACQKKVDRLAARLFGPHG